MIPHGKNKTVHLVVGPPGSGKSWVCRQLPHVCHLDTDKIPRCELEARLIDATHQRLPIVMDLTIKVSTTLKKYQELTWILYVIVEDRSVVVERLLSRGGKVTQTLDNRIRRMQSFVKRAKAHGTSRFILEEIKRDTIYPAA
jgi:dephospho-CoA kinase